MSAGIYKPKMSSTTVSTLLSSPSRAAVIIARVYANFIRSPTPYGPPVQPVLTRKTFALNWSIFSPSISAYLSGESGKNGDPKQAENAGSGSVTPRSVPANRLVYPLKKWYIACSFVNLLIGGNVPEASAVKKIIVFGCPATLGVTMLSILSKGYAARVFSVNDVSK